MKNFLYRCLGEVETLMKKLENTDKQLRESLQQVKSTAEDSLKNSRVLRK
jgi:hypothetical protein